MEKLIYTPKIIGIGEVVFDILPDCRKLGGAPAEFLHYAVKSGAHGFLISAIGADDLGREVVAELEKFNITPVLAITPYPTGRVLVVNGLNGKPMSHIIENSAWDYIPFTSAAEEHIKTADAIYFGTLGFRNTYSKNTLLDLIENAPKNVCRFFDVNFRQNYYNKIILNRLLENADILKLNIEEMKILKTIYKLKGSVEEICLNIQETYNLKYLILTDALKESKIFGETMTSVSNSHITQTFAYGAGNAFGGAFISSLLQGKNQIEAHHIANQAAIEVCQSIQNIGQSFKCGER